MQLPTRLHRLAVIGVVVTGAVASIATTQVFATLQASLDLPPAQLSQAHPVATYRIHATAMGSAHPEYPNVIVDARSVSGMAAPVVLTAHSSVSSEQGEPPRLIEVPTISTGADINCDALPCADDVDVRIELRPRADGTWPPPDEWTLSAELQIDFDGRRDVPPGVSGALELVQ